MYCVRCERRYELDRDTLMLEGFTCQCGAPSMPSRFAVRPARRSGRRRPAREKPEA
jgi:hypothetical protein